MQERHRGGLRIWQELSRGLEDVRITDAWNEQLTASVSSCSYYQSIALPKISIYFLWILQDDLDSSSVKARHIRM